jgi:urea transporter
MTILGKNVLPEVQLGTVPFWRQFLRGFSQCAFQANEITGLIFVVAVAVYNWRMAAFYVMSVLIATVVARLLKADRTLLDLGLFGFNSGLMGLAMGNFYFPDTALWVWVAVLAVVAAAVAVAMAKWLPIPFLAAPFILTFWMMWFIADARPELIKLDFGPWPNESVKWLTALVAALGSTLFAPAVLTGLLFLVGLLVSNWRHAVIAVVAAGIAVALAAHIGVAGGAINSGFVGFNAVLAALAAAVVIQGDLRMAVLAALLATWFFSYINRNAPVPALASGFVVAVWFVMFLDWLHRRFGPGADKARDDTETATGSAPTAV